ncbi:V-ATPase V1 sector subunit E [Orbilia oligospora]|uniref:V-ATPase V1 sector subunit E n=1 Tax=Orbilia oligospora TaxID=2813651 RepID=A0A7C8IWQ8_ORBOL|nr:V-ATPase V1 sector subunit E [Orbilia oligospora]KAF3084296.1 V-ATPase V1 sector subunit E [Orbilia oligospora]KAF3108356.1 V-ATPase V1 sector subunit E [Orbilia oligospora]KAF3122579.1 V-ATPase V1 sector subunit E [Orbilia oligospora]KAF3127669.1 V-ATPase V1 sector subunit E [Orbilia oligospora]
MSLTDDQVAGELKKMTAFIRQEAQEKAHEIQIKADEEFTIEKGRLVRSETVSIDTQFERKHKQAELSQQIARSNVTNKTRLKVLGVRQELLENIFEDARKSLGQIANDKARYAGVLEGLILEGAFALAEPSISVRARKMDFDLVKSAADSASSAYTEKTGQNIKITLDEAGELPTDCAGGVFVISGNGRIDINNTFEERLSILEDEALPAVRNTLFGPSPNRKFYD